MRTLRERVGEGWEPAADACQDCQARYAVRVTAIEDDGVSGIVRVRARHEPWCESAELALVEEQEQAVGWTLSRVAMALQGRAYPMLISWLDVMPCGGCDRLLVGVPVILFAPHGAAVLCPSCVANAGLTLVPGGAGAAGGNDGDRDESHQDREEDDEEDRREGRGGERDDGPSEETPGAGGLAH